MPASAACLMPWVSIPPGTPRVNEFVSTSIEPFRFGLLCVFELFGKVMIFGMVQPLRFHMTHLHIVLLDVENVKRRT